MKLPTATTVEFKYDPLGRRIEKKATESGVTTTTRYLYDNEDIILEYDGSGSVANKYVHGPGIDEPLAVTQGKETYFYHADGLGSIVALTDKSGKVVQDYQYDSFGKLKDLKNRIKQPYSYTGREFDRETGMYYYRARYYDAAVGRFVSKDPIGFKGGINYYSYVQNNPSNFSDPTGLVNWSGSLSGGSAITGVGAGFFFFNLTSECKCNRKINISGRISSVAAGAGARFTGTDSPVSLYDCNECPDPYVANGGAAILSAGVAAGNMDGDFGSGGFGFSISKITIGNLFSRLGIGESSGLDFSAGYYVGASIVTNINIQQCQSCEN